MSTDLTPMELIPVLDLQPLLDGDERGINALAVDLGKALEQTGFFSIINHGVPWSMVELSLIHI